MTEYMVKLKIGGAGTYNVPIKNRVLGVYSTVAVKVGWDFNGEVGEFTPSGVQIWEPRQPFEPGMTSKLIITATAATDVLIRME